jgi:hypothetical protein
MRGDVQFVAAPTAGPSIPTGWSDLFVAADVAEQPESGRRQKHNLRRLGSALLGIDRRAEPTSVPRTDHAPRNLREDINRNTPLPESLLWIRERFADTMLRNPES